MGGKYMGKAKLNNYPISAAGRPGNGWLFTNNR